MASPPTLPQQVWTIGHSNHPIETFLALLAHYRIEAIADVRRFPGSRRLPQFGEEALRACLAEHDIRYEWLPELGGRRRPRADTPHTAWRNESFRGYADHLGSAEFSRGMERLLALAQHRRTAMMCAEVLWWRCHRALVSDVLKLKGIEVLHIQSEQQLIEHPYSSPARLFDGELHYGERGIGLSEQARARPSQGQLEL